MQVNKTIRHTQPEYSENSRAALLSISASGLQNDRVSSVIPIENQSCGELFWGEKEKLMGTFYSWLQAYERATYNGNN